MCKNIFVPDITVAFSFLLLTYISRSNIMNNFKYKEAIPTKVRTNKLIYVKKKRGRINMTIHSMEVLNVHKLFSEL